MGVEKAKASGRRVEMVVVGDDVGVGRTQSGKVGRRGIAGTVLVVKIAGALAVMGAGLEEVSGIARQVAKNVVSVGASLSRVHVPGHRVESPGEKSEAEVLLTEEVEMGMGIHNEPGSRRVRVDLVELVRTLLAQLLDWKDEDRAFLMLGKGDGVVLLVNNLGGVSGLEMGGITAEVVGQLERDYGIKPVRILSGTYMTSLNGIGFSISILKISDTGLGSGKSILELLDAPAEATGWSAAIKTETWDRKFEPSREKTGDAEDESKPSNLQMDPAVVKKALAAGLERLIAAEPDVTKYDTVVGDGDCGIGLKHGAEAILDMLKRTELSQDAVVTVSHIVRVVEKSMDGTSGALYAIFLNALAHNLRTQSTSSPTQVTPQIWAHALQSSLDSLSKYTPARPGDRTLVDALHPFIETLAKTGNTKEAAKAAKEGAHGTKGMKASLGRTVYVGGGGWQEVPDPGAHGLSEFLTGLAEAL
ncbi:MAG: hypothetical protein M1830_005816 [Pleopsidium flavum]|nr:MAG: hypothetical protein M1830_005816 [Pleopsidium flavum]